MAYEAQNFERLIGMKGLSEQLLRDHFTLYQGYVANFNKLDELLQGMEKEGKFGTPEYSELNRRFGWEFNGMRLHELYFGNMSASPKAPDAGSLLTFAITKEFGSFDMWDKDFRAMGTMRGIGWVILYYDQSAARLFNVWVNEHDMGHFAGATPLAVMDVFEHAYVRDYGLNRKEYIGAFMSGLDWNVMSERFSRAASS